MASCRCYTVVPGKKGAMIQPCIADTVLLGCRTWNMLLVTLNGCGGRGGSPSQPYFSQFPVDGSRGLLLLQLRSDGTEQTLSKQVISVQRRGHDTLQSLFQSLFLRSVKRPKISGLSGQPCCGGGCCGWTGLCWKLLSWSSPVLSWREDAEQLCGLFPEQREPRGKGDHHFWVWDNQHSMFSGSPR